MPGGGLFSLVAYGSQNVLLSGNPDMTYFYKTFKKYTHFSLETTSKLMDGPTDFPYDKGVQLKARIDRVGDLLTDLYFSFQIPAIYSKYQVTNPTTGPKTQQEFQWVRYLGLAAIESVYVTVGPNKIQEFTGEYLIAKALIDYPADKFAKWQQMVGDVPELYDPANGLYGNRTATNGEYPTVYPDSRNPGQCCLYSGHHHSSPHSFLVYRTRPRTPARWATGIYGGYHGEFETGESTLHNPGLIWISHGPRISCKSRN